MTVLASVEAGVARLAIANPPANALSISNGTAAALVDAVIAASADPDVAFITIEGAAGRFCAGADIADFDLPVERMAEARRLYETVNGASKPVIALITGEALGGGLELALACHARICVSNARLGLPEITLGLLPGGGGTQRLPRLIGAGRALDMMLSGKFISGRDAGDIGLVDRVVDSAEDLQRAAHALHSAGVPVRPKRERAVGEEIARICDAHARLLSRSGAARDIATCVETAVRLPIAEGLKVEANLFDRLMLSLESRALRYAFFSERSVARIPGLEDVAPREVGTVGIVGAGTMGAGIALAALNAGYSVALADNDPKTCKRARAHIEGLIDRDVEKGRLKQEEASSRKARLVFGESLEVVAEADLVIEAVFEDMAVKKEVLARLEATVKSDCIIASNTSTLDLDELATAVREPERVIGLHFFSPAHIMRLLEVIRGRATHPDCVATALSFAKKLGKVPVVSGVCDGFIGNRMFEEMLRQAYFLLEEGAYPEQVDAALERFGMAMGPLRVMDLAGQDIGYKIRQRRMTEHPDRPYSRIPDIITEQGRLGQKTGAGFYDYRGGGKAVVSQDVNEVIMQFSREAGIERRAIGDEEIVDRCILALVNEGAKIVEEGIAARPLDVDMVWLNGYGFPRERGGPMFHVDQLGLSSILARIREFEAGRHGWAWAPAPLLERLAEMGESLASLNGSRGDGA
ncbi:3-hydroxyacyl-CoA dehydrogenase NAD-binding domain-containing protein [Sphingobium sp.]|uniref:3-hydroxyacyl-CoA dehydrogenase NAD-binding domain-containing protein n=1 Tax=Sphingobium sp. TaxID=1912891 RepID=UPI0028BDBC6C|nr:3-hydroxyacyl-CoA dehydrogenase NAD-binding domain-containing protein [Sphingobium sp.]